MFVSIHQEILFATNPGSLYAAYMIEEVHAAFTGVGANINFKEGGSFTCGGGSIEGRTLELVGNERIVQAWRLKSWEAGIFSIVRIELRPEGDDTRLILDHTGVPAAMEEKIKAGWHEWYWGPLKKYLCDD